MTGAREIWRKADAVCFDVDSTLIRVEGIVYLAKLCGAENEVTQLTNSAMSGSMTFRESLQKRLNIIQPTQQQIQQFKVMHTPESLFTPDVVRLIQLLQYRKVDIYLISGGFYDLIEPLAEYLNIPRDHIFANRLIFDKDGHYSGFDENEPTSRSGGKPLVISEIKKKHNRVVMIGDGVTDLEASPPADTFIGFGGNVVREKVMKEAPWFVYKFQDLITELEEDVTNH